MKRFTFAPPLLAGRRTPSVPIAVAGAATLLAACEGALPSGPADLAPTEPRMAVTATAANVDVYVHAHQDDWQLFMGDRVAASVSTAGKVVVVYATAGDGGAGAAYWQTRERAAQASMDAITPAGTWTCATQTIRTHPIKRCTKGTVVGYYMYLPDGNYENGTGFGFGSLMRLRDQGTALSARDGSTTYTSWADFYGTIGGIVDQEAAGVTAPYLTVNAPDYDRILNPADHQDHWATGDAVRAASSGRSWNLAWYVDYATESRSANLGDQAHATKYAEFNAYDQTMVAAGYASLINTYSYPAWLWRTYFRTETTTTPPPPPPPPPPSTEVVKPTNLTARGDKTGANRRVDLAWQGNASVVDVWRNGSVLRKGVSGKSYTDTPEKKASGTFTYQVCTTGKSGADNCSNTAAVVF